MLEKEALSLETASVGQTTAGSQVRRGLARKRILIVNAYFDDLRRVGGRPYSHPKAIGPPYVAGAFSPSLCELRLYNEQHSGSLSSEALLAWPDMLVLTGLTAAFDRMRQLTAYARSKNPRVIVVAGGPGVRALPRLSQHYFDYPCNGDIEEMRDVIMDALGAAYIAEDMFPRFDLTPWFGRIAYIESSRNCNFKCSFCSLTGEKNTYQTYELAYIRRQILAVGYRPMITFLDNNFYGNDRTFFLQRMALLKEMRAAGHFGHWTALVTNDFFLKQANLDLAREAGCLGLFSGVESFSTGALKGFNKHQNVVIPQVELIKRCLDAGLMFAYGVIFDFTTRRLRECKEELSVITGTSEISLPAFVTQAIPLIGTPYFHQCVADGVLLPSTKLRDMDGSTLVSRPLDPIDQITEFLRGLPQLRGYRRRVLCHALGFLRRYHRHLSMPQLAIAMTSAAMIVAPRLASAPLRLGTSRRGQGRRTYVTTTEILDADFHPIFPVDSRYEDYFQPTMITDHTGALAEQVVEDLAV